MAFPLNSTLREETSQNRKEQPSTLSVWPPYLPIQRDRVQQSRPGVNPFTSFLPVAHYSVIFPQAKLSGHFVCKSERGTRDGAFLYTLYADKAGPLFPASRH